MATIKEQIKSGLLAAIMLFLIYGLIVIFY